MNNDIKKQNLFDTDQITEEINHFIDMFDSVQFIIKYKNYLMIKRLKNASRQEGINK